LGEVLAAGDPLKEKTMSLATRIGLPEQFQNTVLLLGFLLALAPYLAGVKIGSLQVPTFERRKRRMMRLCGPLVFLVTLALVVPVPVWLASPRPEVKVLAADVASNGDLDVVIANAGPGAALLTRIEIEVLRDLGRSARSILESSATYKIPIDALRPGQRRSLVVRHSLPAAATERILIAPRTARSLEVRLHLFLAEGGPLSADFSLGAP
jgi:hypothetical protein